jgi:hypothetical protein
LRVSRISIAENLRVSCLFAQVKLHGHEYFLRLQAFCAKEASKEFELDDAKWSAEEDYIFEQALAAYNEGNVFSTSMLWKISSIPREKDAQLVIHL